MFKILILAIVALVACTAEPPAPPPPHNAAVVYVKLINKKAEVYPIDQNDPGVQDQALLFQDEKPVAVCYAGNGQPPRCDYPQPAQSNPPAPASPAPASSVPPPTPKAAPTSPTGPAR